MEHDIQWFEMQNIALADALAEMPLHRVKADTEIIYRSAIALKLARQENAVNIAHKIACCLSQKIETNLDGTKFYLLDKIWRSSTIQTVSPGWIDFHFSQQSIGEWLQALVSQPVCLNNSSQLTIDRTNVSADIRNSASTFHILYTYARCSTLLRSADTDAIIRLAPFNLELAADPRMIIAPQPLPWLIDNDRLKCQHSAEQALIVQIIDILDELFRLGDRAPIWKLAQALSHKFHEFYAACRIWGTVKSTDLQLAQVRLGLVLITQKLLWLLLQWIGISTPVEL
ncbi:MAG: hypothetical protein HC772_14725 [Leptolyngbyaceae cyanobacterium CRU_2_3]|nr:hypothetical protein [Leptolyngbyaceae cyanobacterium CRU_2_3]